MANAPARPVQGEAGVGPVALLLLGLVLLVGIGIYLSRSPNVSVAGMTQNTARMEAAALQQTGSAVAGAFGAAMMRDSFLPNQITFDTAARTSTSIGLFNASEGYLAQPAQQTSALVAATVGANPVTWQRMQANITGIGSGSGLYGSSSTGALRRFRSGLGARFFLPSALGAANGAALGDHSVAGVDSCSVSSGRIWVMVTSLVTQPGVGRPPAAACR